ncbi:MAG TPA: ion transporter [Verrucomicrobiales bacterium]|nr:ion transporter [Verrucomicrobiales bacterium]
MKNPSKNQSSNARTGANAGRPEEVAALKGWRLRLYVVIFGSDTPAGKAFDVGLFVAIVLSVIVVMLESVAEIRERHHVALYRAEWAFTILFTIEYILRLMCVPRPLRYSRSFFGVVDLLAILPTYVNLLLSGTHYLMIIRVLRLLRVFRVFKLARYLSESQVLIRALRASRVKISVFLFSVVTLVMVIGATMYIVEGEASGFTSIPRSVYWAIVTLTTVGYGDVTPQSPLGQFLASIVMILGYGIIAVPTGIVSVELHEASRRRLPRAICQACGMKDHEADAHFCRQCGAPLELAGKG